MLDEKDLEMIKQMIVSTLSAVSQPCPSEKPKKARKPYKKRVKKTLKVDKTRKKPIIEETPEPVKGQPRIRKVGRVMNQTGEVHGKHGKQCRTESFDTSAKRSNNFLKMAEAKMFKNDTVIDKKLSGNNQITPRRTDAELWEVCCQKCGRAHIVSPSTVMIDPDDGSVLFTCDSCIIGRR